MLKLYYAPGTCALASHIALEEAGADYEAQRIDFSKGEQRSPDYLKVNPKGRVPALLTDQGVLTESPVILGYIAQTHPDAKLAPNDDSFKFGDVQAFNVFITSSVHIAFAHIFRASRYGEEDAAEGMKRKALASLTEYFGMIDEKIGAKDWVHAYGYTISDPYLYVMSFWTGRIGMDLAPFPNVARHKQAVEARPAVRRVLEQQGISV